MNSLATISGRKPKTAGAWTKYRPDYKPAIAELENALDMVETNAPINEKEGDKAQAKLERKNAESFKAAIERLKS
jgi:hypothetical protein